MNLFPTQIEELILTVPALAPQFQCVLDRPGRMDTLTVRVEARHDSTPEHRVTAGIDLQKLVKNRIGVTITVDVLDPAALERSIGKARRLIDNRAGQGSR